MRNLTKIAKQFVASSTIFIFAGCIPFKQMKTKVFPLKSVSEKKTIDETKLSTNYHYLISRIHIRNNDYDKAIQSLKKALVKDPYSYILTRDLTLLYLDKNDTKTAEALTERLIKNSNKNIDALFLLLHVKKNTIKEQESIEIFKKIISLDPSKNKKIYLRLGKIYLEKKDKENALKLFEQMTSHFSDYYAAWFYLGKSHMDFKQYSSAKNAFLKTIELEPDLLQPRFELIKIYNIENNKTQTKKLYNEMLEIEPENNFVLAAMALYYYKNNNTLANKWFDKLGSNFSKNSKSALIFANHYFAEKKHEDAAIIFSQILKKHPDNQNLIFLAGLAYEALEEYDEAMSFYLKLGPEYSEYKKIILIIALIHKKKGDIAKAIDHLEKHHKIFPDNIDIIDYLVSFYDLKKEFIKAIALLEKTLLSFPDNTSLLFRLGEMQDKIGLKHECIKKMERIIEIDPKNSKALNYLGYTYAELGIKLEKAYELIKKAYELEPNDGYITDSLGWVYYKMKNYEKAIEYLEKASKLKPDDPIILYHLADAYKKNNQLNNALKFFEKALSHAKKKKIIEKIKIKIKEIREKNEKI